LRRTCGCRAERRALSARRKCPDDPTAGPPSGAVPYDTSPSVAITLADPFGREAERGCGGYRAGDQYPAELRTQDLKSAASDKRRLAEEENDALQKAVTDQGLSVDEYSSIIRIAEYDPAVRQKLAKRIPHSGQSRGVK